MYIMGGNKPSDYCFAAMVVCFFGLMWAITKILLELVWMLVEAFIEAGFFDLMWQLTKDILELVWILVEAFIAPVVETFFMDDTNHSRK